MSKILELQLEYDRQIDAWPVRGARGEMPITHLCDSGFYELMRHHPLEELNASRPTGRFTMLISDEPMEGSHFDLLVDYADGSPSFRFSARFSEPCRPTWRLHPSWRTVELTHQTDDALLAEFPRLRCAIRTWHEETGVFTSTHHLYLIINRNE